MAFRKILVAAALLAALAAPAPAGAEAVTQWNVYASNVLFPAQGTLGIVNLAMMNGAVYDAVNGIDRGHRPYLVLPAAQPFDSTDAAVATAAYRVLVGVLPAAQSDLAARYTAFLAGVPDGLAKAGGVAAGETAAAAMLAARANDGRNGAFRFVTGTGPGRWRPEPPAFVSDPVAWLKDVKPFVVRSASQLRADAPDPLTSRRYARDYDEVKSMGSATSTVRTADQTSAARFWAENGPRTWSRILRTLAGQRDASTAVNARLYAMAYMATADALITVWEGKAQWSFWRPITAIRQTGGERGDPAWAPLIDTPPYPDHPSGLSAVAAAMVRTAQLVFGTDGVAFSDTNVAGIARSFTTLSQAANEVVDARVWSGIHFRNADTQGAAIGVDVAEWSARHYFRPARGDEEDDVVHVGGDGD